MRALGDDDRYLFHEGSLWRAHDILGAHLVERDAVRGVRFAVWAPHARRVAVIGDWNGWTDGTNPMENHDGVWEAFVPGIGAGALYKLHVVAADGRWGDKADPFGFAMESPPRTASIVTDLSFAWSDADWIRHRLKRNALSAPISIYEVHLGSWRRAPDGRHMNYREIAPRLIEHVHRCGFTHVELMPLTEHPFYGSWGYQVAGYFAATRRYGTPQDLMALIDALHREGIGVILDWVPGHFPSDEHGLAYFDGTHLFEHPDPKQAWHPEWKSLCFDFGKPEVRSFLLSSAMFWLDRYHVDGLRIDGVASMLYLDYARGEGQWVPNALGGRENLDAIAFFRKLAEAVRAEHPDVLTIAEDSTSWPMVTRPPEVGGLGFSLKWDMGWMHDTLKYLHLDPVHRKFHHEHLTFRSMYQNDEAYVLPLSHDEVVHGKYALVTKMHGDEWQRHANVRLLFASQWLLPGKKLLFMGCELAQEREWDHEGEVAWHRLHSQLGSGTMRFVADLNALYRDHPALHRSDCDGRGFEWVDGSDVMHSVITFLRRAHARKRVMLCAFNFTPVPRLDYHVGVPWGGRWAEVLNTDAESYGGSGMGNMGGVEAEELTTHGRPFTVRLTLPPLAAVVFRSPSQPRA